MGEETQTVVAPKATTVSKEEVKKTIDPNLVKEKLEESLKKEEVLTKEVIIKAVPTFVITPVEVESEAYNVIGCPLKGRSVYIPLSPAEIADVAQEMFGFTNPDTVMKEVKDYFHSYRIRIDYASNEVGAEEDGYPLTIPIDENGEVVWNKKYADDIVAYRICLQSKRVATEPMEIAEARAPGETNFIAYLLDKGKEQILVRQTQKIRRQADIAFLKVTDKGKERELTWLARVISKGIELGNGITFRPSKVAGDVSAMLSIDKESILSELRDKYPKSFLNVVNDPNLEMRSLVEQLIDIGTLVRTGNVVKYADEVLGTNIDETIDELKKPTRSNLIVELKAAARID